MKSAQFPNGGRAWFVRFRTGEGCQMEPASAQGWILTSVYLLLLAAISWTFLAAEPDAGDWFAWAVLIAAGTLLFSVTAYRMSASIPAPAPKASKRARRRPNARQQLLLAVATALVMMVAAWLSTL